LWFGGGGNGKVVSPSGHFDPAVKEGREREKGKDGSLSWGVQVIIYSTFKQGSSSTTSTRGLCDRE